MAATVTIDRGYFETLLRRAKFHIAGQDLSTLFDIPIVSIPKIDHDNLLRMAQEYTNLKEALYNGGIQPETLDILIRGGDLQTGLTDTFVEDNNGERPGGVGLCDRPSQARVTLSSPSGTQTNWPPTSTVGTSHPLSKGRGDFMSRNNSCNTQEDDMSWDPDLNKDVDVDVDIDPLAIPHIKKRYAREEQRTVLARNLADRVSHKDITNIVRGGLVLDVYLRTNERSASISFVEASTARNFMNYVKKNDVYIHGKRLEFIWNDRQFILPGHVANKIGIGATRNLVIRNVHPNVTEERLREDLDHIHNLVIIDIIFQSGNVYLQLNSIHNSLFARTCMMSRATYKGMKIDWYPDECAQPLPKPFFAPKKDNRAPSPVKKTGAMINRFEMLNIDGTQDSSEEGDDSTVLQDLSKMHINRSSPWNARTVAA